MFQLRKDNSDNSVTFNAWSDLFRSVQICPAPHDMISLFPGWSLPWSAGQSLQDRLASNMNPHSLLVWNFLCDLCFVTLCGFPVLSDFPTSHCGSVALHHSCIALPTFHNFLATIRACLDRLWRFMEVFLFGLTFVGFPLFSSQAVYARYVSPQDKRNPVFNVLTRACSVWVDRHRTIAVPLCHDFGGLICWNLTHLQKSMMYIYIYIP